MSTATMKERPIGVTILAILAGVAALFAIVHALQALGIIPYFIGPFAVRSFSFWYFLMWALMVWVYIWLVQMLWDVDPSAWMFLAVITVFNLVMDFIVLVTSTTEWTDVNASIIVNVVILAYCMLPGVRSAFGTN
jgi:hypothetical protein